MSPEAHLATIRPASLADIPAIVAVQARSWRSAYRGLVSDEYLDALPLQDWVASWRAHFFSEATACVVAEVDARVVGFASSGRPVDMAELGPEVGELHTIYMDADHQGTGLGRRLMTAALDHLTLRGYRAATLWVLSGNQRAIRFYERGGWHPDGATGSDCWGATSLERVRYRRDLGMATGHRADPHGPSVTPPPG